MKIMVALPCMDMMHSLTTKSLLGLNIPEGTVFNFAIGSLVYDSRNQMVADAIMGGYDAVLWIDSDMVFGGDLLDRLMETMTQTGADLVTAVYTTRRMPLELVLLDKLDISDAGEISMQPVTEIREGPFEIDACGFGICLTKTSMLQKAIEAGMLPFSPIVGLGEDYSFCWRAKKLGARLICDGSLMAGHIGELVFDASLLPILGGPGDGQ